MTTFTLSTLDGSAPHGYIRYALTFACNAEQIDGVVDKLRKATKRLVSEIPMLAGEVTTNEHHKPTVAVTMEQVDGFKPTIGHLKNDHQNYSAIRHGGIAPKHISGTAATPLANDCAEDTNPCCAIQANLIDDGLIMVIYLHHAIADIQGLAAIVRLMSEGLPARELNTEALQLEAAMVSQARERLSKGAGAPAFLASARDVEQRQQQSRQQEDAAQHDAACPAAPAPPLQAPRPLQTADLINTRRSLHDPSAAAAAAATDKLTPREVLIAILWRAYVRARWPDGTEDGMRTSVAFPVDLRSHLVPPLEPLWMGNAEITTIANEDLLLLGTYYDLSTIERTATIVHAAAGSVASDLLARSRIEMLNSDTNPEDRPAAQFVVHDWTAVPRMLEQGMDLGLGLGRPDAIRRIGRVFAGNEVVLLPENETAQVWEVQVELRRNWLAVMLRDELLRGFLWGVAQ